MSVRKPRLLGADLQPVAELSPSVLTATLNLEPLSSVQMTLPPEEPPLAARDMLEVFGPDGSLGIFRVCAVSETPTRGQDVTLEHGLCLLQDDVLEPQTDAEGNREDIKLQGNVGDMIGALLARQSNPAWQLGDNEASERHEITLQTGSLLSALSQVLALDDSVYLTFDQGARPWVMHLKKRETVPSCECRLTRNMETLRVDTSTTDLCTRLLCPRLPGGKLDAPTQERWGTVTHFMTFGDNVTDAEALRVAETYLKNHQNPRVSIQVGARLLARETGESMDDLRLARLCRVALPDIGAVYEERIISVTYGDLVRQPDKVTLTLASRLHDATAITVELQNATGENSGRGGGGGGGGGKSLKDELDEMQGILRNAEILIDKLNAEIQLRAYEYELTDTRERLSFAGISLEGTPATVTLLAYQKNVDLLKDDVGTTKETLTQAMIRLDGAISRIDIQANDIAALGQRITAQADEISAQAKEIDLQAETIRLKADKTYVDKLVADEINAMRGEVENMWSDQLITNSVSADYVAAGTVDADSFLGGTGYFSSLSISGEKVATQSWVQEQGYLKSVPDTYATQEWTKLNFVTLERLAASGYATQSWVNNQGFLKSVPDSYATKAWVNYQGFITSLPSHRHSITIPTTKISVNPGTSNSWTVGNGGTFYTSYTGN